MKAATKSPPPSGFTGGQGVETSWADCFAWATDWTDGRGPGGNIALAMPDTVVGIDVDCYAGKTGARTIAEAIARWGELPPTWSSSARDDGSGIRLYRIPAGTRLVEAIKFPELAIGHIEIVQRHHRYAMVAPSIHPETRTPYRWRGPNGVITDDVPRVDDLPDLPSRWLPELADGPRGTEAWAASGEVADFLDSLLDGGPCERVSEYLVRK
jgi:bifunctional DNA primase/polymerase-like protein